METSAEYQFAACVGWDWADQKHALCLKVHGKGDPEFKEIKHTGEDIQEWANEMRVRFAGQEIAIAIEQSRGPVIYALMKYEHFVLFPINTGAISSYRKAVRSSGAKDDSFDSELLVDFLMNHLHRLRAWRPEDPQTMKLRRLVEYRRKLVDEASSLSRQMTAVLKEYYPQCVEWFPDLKTPLACDFLSTWSTPAKAQRARANTLREFFYKHNCRNKEYVENRISQIRACRPVTETETIVAVDAEIVQCMLKQMRVLVECIDKMERQIEEAYAQHPDRDIYESLPGAGQALEPRLAVAMGLDRERYENAVAIQRFSGTAPVTEESGKSKWVHWRWACPKFMRQTFTEFAACSLPYCAWAKDCYDRQRAKGTSHHAALRVVAFKWQRILFRCWKDHVPYSEQIYLSRFNRRTAKGGSNKHIIC